MIKLCHLLRWRNQNDVLEKSTTCIVDFHFHWLVYYENSSYDHYQPSYTEVV